MAGTPDFSGWTLAQIRDYVAGREKSARRKMNRNEAKGVNVRGSQFDPLKTPGKVSKMRRRDVVRYADQLNRFIDRGTQFVAGDRGAPLSRSAWENYKAAEQASNKWANELMDQVRDKMITKDQTFENFFHMRTPTNKHWVMRNPPSFNMMRETQREPHEVVSQESLERLTKAARKKVTRQWFNKHMRLAQEQYKEMSDIVQMGDIGKQIAGLSPNQFAVLWNIPGFANSLASIYLIKIGKGVIRYGNGGEEQEAKERADIDEYVDFVKKNVPRTRK